MMDEDPPVPVQDAFPMDDRVMKDVKPPIAHPLDTKILFNLQVGCPNTPATPIESFRIYLTAHNTDEDVSE